MREWYSLKKIAGIVGVPGTERGVRERADKEAWQYIDLPARCRGGHRREYHISSLPSETRQALIESEISAIPTAGAALPAVQTPTKPVQQNNTAQLKQWQRHIMDARLVVLSQIDQIEDAIGLNKAIEAFLRMAEEQTLPTHIQQIIASANARSGGNIQFSRSTLLNWRRQRESGIAALAPKEKRITKTPDWAPALLKAWRKPQKPALSDALRECRLLGFEIGYHQARRYLKRVGEVEKQRGRRGPRYLKDIRPFKRRDTSTLLPGDIYIGDGHTFDAEVAHPDHGRPFRPEITTWVDVHTRRIAGWSVDLAESSLAVLAALTHAVERLGVPAVAYADNGRGYKNQLMSAEGTGMMARLGIELTHSLPYNSQSRGIIERIHRTVYVPAAKTLPTYIGAPMDGQAKQIVYKTTRKNSEKLLPWLDFLALLESAIDAYERRTHSSLPKIRDPQTGAHRHVSPLEIWHQARAEGWQPTQAGELDDLYRPQVPRTVNRGEVSLWNNRYFSSALEEWHKQNVLVAFDVHDASRIWVRDAEQRLICKAELNGNLTDYMPQSFMERAREKRATGRLQRLERKAEEIRLERQASGPRLIDVTPEQQAKADQIIAQAERRRELAAQTEQEQQSKVIPISAPKQERKLLGSQHEIAEWVRDRISNGEAGDYEQQWMDDYERMIFQGKRGGLIVSDPYLLHVREQNQQQEVANET